MQILSESHFQEQDKSSGIEQKPPFGDGMLQKLCLPILTISLQVNFHRVILINDFTQEEGP